MLHNSNVLSVNIFCHITITTATQLNYLAFLITALQYKMEKAFRLIQQWPYRLGLLALLITSVTSLAVDMQYFSQVMQQRYGTQAFQLAGQLNQLLGQLRQTSESDKLAQINHFFNQHIDYGDDLFIYKAKDYWASPGETIGIAAGDCEDFAIAKYVFLKILGISNEKLRLTYVKAYYNGRRQAHMVLSYYPSPSSEPYILDNIKPQILPASSRSDLSPIFSFNDQGLWAANSPQNRGSASSRLSRWRNLLVKLQQEGLQ